MQPVKPNHKWLSGQILDGFHIPYGDIYDWDLSFGVTPTIEKG
jgi:hypothetical protein